MRWLNTPRLQSIHLLWCSIHHILSSLIRLAPIPRTFDNSTLFIVRLLPVENRRAASKKSGRILFFFSFSSNEKKKTSQAEHCQTQAIRDVGLTCRRHAVFCYQASSGLHPPALWIFFHLQADTLQHLWYKACLISSILYSASFRFIACPTCLCKCWYEYLSLHSILLWLMYTAPHTPCGRYCRE